MVALGSNASSITKRTIIPENQLHLKQQIPTTSISTPSQNL